jgi:hypothetical protein
VECCLRATNTSKFLRLEESNCVRIEVLTAASMKMTDNGGSKHL